METIASPGFDFRGRGPECHIGEVAGTLERRNQERHIGRYARYREIVALQIEIGQMGAVESHILLVYPNYQTYSTLNGL